MTRKMPRADRRAQLLETAHAIVREQGTDMLTLGALAERAGVSKPIAYSHFCTRAGLMIALYRELYDRQVEIVVASLRRAPARLAEVAWVIADSHMECYADIGREWHAIAAALRGEAEMAAHQREMTEGCVALYFEALAPLSSLPAEHVRRRCFAIIGAADALADEMARGNVTRDQASEDLAGLIVSWLSPPAA
ncbi:TetR/AcrR family transcriptional regulator [Pseudochelatococcus sp. B33]